MTTTSSTRKLERIAVIGAGIMGHGIAQEFAISGRQVSLYDIDQSRLDAALDRISENLTSLSRSGDLTVDPAAILRGLTVTTTLETAVSNVDYVVEAAPEQLPLKQALFTEMDQYAPPHAILASNTSTFRPSLLAAATNRPQQVLVTHYFNPPHLVPLVEVVRGPETTDEVVTAVVALLNEVGKTPVTMQKEAPGFIGNRLQLALVREALSIVRQGLATVEDVDLVVRTSIGRRWSVAGPFETLDAAGLDTLLSVAGQLFSEIESSPDVPVFLRELVEAGHFGLKSGGKAFTTGHLNPPPRSVAASNTRSKRSRPGTGKGSEIAEDQSALPVAPAIAAGEALVESMSRSINSRIRRSVGKNQARRMDPVATTA